MWGIFCLKTINLTVLIFGLAVGFDAAFAAQDISVFGRSLTRLHIANNDTQPREGVGLTQSLQIAAEKKLSNRFSILAEGEAVYAIVGKFNDGTGNNPNRVFIPDPNTLELNRLQLQYTPFKETFITIGRQTLGVDDQRFIGATPFRQNTQTFDAIHVSKRFGTSGTFQAGYFNKALRPLGGDNINGRFRGDSYFFAGNLQTPLGRIGAFHYALDLEGGPDSNPTNGASSVTTGVRVDGRWHRGHVGLMWEGSYAEQRDFADNPLDFSTKYWLAAGRFFFGQTRFGFRTEVLGGGRQRAFQTPLASLRKFQGFANVFLITPLNGVVDHEANFAWEAGTIGQFKRASVKVAQHWFKADRGGAEYGSETDITFEGTWRGAVISLGAAFYSADTFASNTSRLIFSVRKHF